MSLLISIIRRILCLIMNPPSIAAQPCDISPNPVTTRDDAHSCQEAIQSTIVVCDTEGTSQAGKPYNRSDNRLATKICILKYGIPSLVILTLAEDV